MEKTHVRFYVLAQPFLKVVLYFGPTFFKGCVVLWKKMYVYNNYDTKYEWYY